MSRPRVTLKLATSLDGRIATAAGESRWISGASARAEVQILRAAHDAVMIGAQTARLDNPSLLARTDPPPPRQPMRVVVTTAFDIPSNGRLFEALDLSPLIVLGGAANDAASRILAAGAKTGLVGSQGLGHGLGQGLGQGLGLDIGLVFSALQMEWRIDSVLVEGGGQLAASCIAADAVDRIEWFRAPIVLGAGGRPAVGALAAMQLSQAPRWRRVALRELGPDTWESYERVC